MLNRIGILAVLLMAAALAFMAADVAALAHSAEGVAGARARAINEARSPR